MRVLLLLRGAPGCGKTTWIRENGLAPYALSADEIRTMCASPEQTPDGGTQISQKNEGVVWDMLFKLLEIRMQKGEFTVIDATNSKTAEMKRYKDLCDDYRYRIYLVDFTSIPIDVAKARNAGRPEMKRVPAYVIEKMYSRFETQKVPSGITVISPDELEKVWIKPLDFSDYKAVHVIGDVHGCWHALMDAFPHKDDGGDPVLPADELYIFVGDYVDRGIENGAVLRFLMNIYTQRNVILLEGNHERWLWMWANGETTPSKEFELRTRTEIEKGEEDVEELKKNVRRLYRKMAQCAWFTYGEDEFLVTHGGISRFPWQLTLLSSCQMMQGVGSYNEVEIVDNAFAKNTPDRTFQIHGHRNAKHLPVRVNDRAFNLEGGVEFGGELRVVDLYPDGRKETREIKNFVFAVREDRQEDKTAETVGDAILALRRNKYVQEKSFGNISSFNFTRAAFYDKIWDAQTTKARGFYVNIPHQKIVARSYDKFFNVNEREETKLEALRQTLEFPVTAYVKENGFLGIAAYNDENDSLFVTTKSSPDGPYADWLREMIVKKVSPENAGRMKRFSKDHNVSFVFECVDMTNDPHVIEYGEDHLFLLDIVYNSLDFKKFPYDELTKAGQMFGLEVKKQAFVLDTWQDFYDWYYKVLEEDYTYEDKEIEGFVLEDAEGYMVKLKLAYYNFWKFMRSIAHKTIKCGALPGKMMGSLTTPTANRFYAWVRDHEHREELPESIVTLRRMFYEDMKKETKEP